MAENSEMVKKIYMITEIFKTPPLGGWGAYD
jgi:hypothetical protein